MSDMAVAHARQRLRAATRWHQDRLATLHWWTDPQLLRALGPGLAGLHPRAAPTVIAGVQSSGYLLAPLVALTYEVGMLGVQQHRASDSVSLAVAAEALDPSDRVLLVDDVIESGGQASAVRDLIVAHGAQWVGVAAMVSYRQMPELNLQSLSDIADLP